MIHIQFYFFVIDINVFDHQTLDYLNSPHESGIQLYQGND